MNNWFKKHEKLLVFFGIDTVATIIVTYLTFQKIILNANLLEEYSKTKIITPEMTNLANFGFFAMLMIGIWTILFIVLFLKMLFPTKESLSKAFCIDELNYLKNLPQQIKRGIDNE